MDNRPIGIFDSGMGGLTVWREVRRALPDESIIYLGDGARCPYGSRPPEEICRFAEEAVERLADCKLIVVACNTATAAAIDHLRQTYSLPIVGMEPAIKPACLETRSRVVGVLATERSLEGDLFRRTAARYGADIELVTAPGQGFVELVERDMEQSDEALAQCRKVLQPILDRGADRIVLGCTHYPFLLPTLQRAAEGYDTRFVDPSPAVARRVVQLLDCHQLHTAERGAPRYTFLSFSDECYVARLEAKAFGNKQTK